MTENVNEQVPEAVNQNELLVYGEVFYQLLQFSWFRDMFECQFDIQKVVDEEEKTIELRVIEVPPDVSSARLAALQAEQIKDMSSHLVMPSSKDIAKVKKSKRR